MPPTPSLESPTPSASTFDDVYSYLSEQSSSSGSSSADRRFPVSAARRLQQIEEDEFFESSGDDSDIPAEAARSSLREGLKALVEREKEKKKNRPSDIRAEAAHSSIREGLKALVEREKKREKSSGDDSDIPTEAVCSSIREGLKALVEKERKKKKAKRFPLGSGPNSIRNGPRALGFRSQGSPSVEIIIASSPALPIAPAAPPIVATPRDIPCLGCIKSALQGQLKAPCRDLPGKGLRCVLCSGGHTCYTRKGDFGWAGRRLVEATLEDNEAEKKKWRACVRPLLEKVDEDIAEEKAESAKGKRRTRVSAKGDAAHRHSYSRKRKKEKMRRGE